MNQSLKRSAFIFCAIFLRQPAQAEQVVVNGLFCFGNTPTYTTNSGLGGPPRFVMQTAGKATAPVEFMQLKLVFDKAAQQARLVRARQQAPGNWHFEIALPKDDLEELARQMQSRSKIFVELALDFKTGQPKGLLGLTLAKQAESCPPQ